jgi:raffinose/stachyose/melibiose transport system substrate-binding protein
VKKVYGFVSLLMVLFLITSAFTACGAGTSTAGSTSTSDAAATAAAGSTAGDSGAQVSNETKTLTLWHIQNDEAVKSIIEDSAARFEADNPGYKLNIQVFTDEALKQKIRIALGSNEAPDIFPGWTGGGMIEYIKANQIKDLTDYMTKDNYKDKFMDAGIAQATYDNKIWCVPVENMSICGIFYNSEIFKKYNISEPKTLAELEAACDTLVKNKVIPFALVNKEKYEASFYYMYLVDRLGGPKVFSDAATRANGGSFENEVFTKAAEKLQEWAKKGYFPKGYNTLAGETAQHRTLMYGDKAAMVLDGAWCISGMKSENPEYFPKLKFMPFPSIDGGTGDPNDVVGTIGDTFYQIASTCKEPDAAFKAIQYLIDDTAVSKRIEAGRLPPVKACTADNPLSQAVLDTISKATNIQLWYDQFLPSKAAEVHKDALQALVGLEITPAEYNSRMEKAMQ